MDQTRGATNRLILLSLSADFNGSAQLQHFFCHSLCGPIWMIFDGPETQHGELFPQRMTFFLFGRKKIRIHNRNFFL